MPVNSFDNYPMSWRPQLKKDKGSIHKELTDLLRKDINEGVLLPGTKLPPQRELADFLDINFTTVTRAYKLCEYKGLIYSVMGSGTFVSARTTHDASLGGKVFRSNVREAISEEKLGGITVARGCQLKVCEEVFHVVLG